MCSNMIRAASSGSMMKGMVKSFLSVSRVRIKPGLASCTATPVSAGLQHALDTLQHDPDTGVSWMTIPREPYESLGATAEDLEGIVDIPRSIAGTEVGLLFRRTKTGEVKISFRSGGLR